MPNIKNFPAGNIAESITSIASKVSGVPIIQTQPEVYNEGDFTSLLKSNCIYSKEDIAWYNKFNRFGCLDPYNRLGITKEYLFFVKPDLHIWEPNTTTLNPQLMSNPFFRELSNQYPFVVQSLQRSAGDFSKSVRMSRNPFMSILSNTVKNTLDLEDLSAEDIDTSANMYGSKLTYRNHTWVGDENFDFSLEFEDSKYLEIYNLVKAYDEYNRLSRFGIVDPPNVDNAVVSSSGYNYNNYVKNRELHDVFGIYKFIVDEDYETIIYYAYLTGVYFKNVPRASFSDITTGDPLKYNLQFHAFSVEDEDPRILEDFNRLVSESYGLDGLSAPGDALPIYDDIKGRVDGDWALCPWITKTYKAKVDASAWSGSDGMQYRYKLTWRK